MVTKVHHNTTLITVFEMSEFDQNWMLKKSFLIFLFNWIKGNHSLDMKTKERNASFYLSVFTYV